jgi:MoxR-like ATPase
MDLNRIIKTLLFTPGPKGRWGIPVLWEGPPGVGKTSMAEAAFREHGMDFETIIAATREPSDFAGLPVVTNDSVVFRAMGWAVRLQKKGRGAVFLDELRNAPPAVQAALLRSILDRVVGDCSLGNGVRFYAAQNAVEHAAGGYDVAAALANRFIHLNWAKPSVDDWSDYLLGGGGLEPEAKVSGDPAAEEKRVLDAWGGPWAKSAGLLTAFLRKRPELHLRVPAAGDPALSKAWPSPRTWDYAAHILAGAEIHGLPVVETETLLTGCVGPGAATEFVAFVSDADLPDPADVLDGKVSFKPDARLDRTLAVFSACAALVTAPKVDKKIDRVKKLWTLLGDQAKVAVDVIVPAARTLVRAKLSAGVAPVEARPVLLKLEPVLRAAGLLGAS